jgi:hypothetical protein
LISSWSCSSSLEYARVVFSHSWLAERTWELWDLGVLTIKIHKGKLLKVQCTSMIYFCNQLFFLINPQM